MSANLEAAIQEQMQVLSDDEQREVLDFIEEIKRRPRKTIWEKLDERLSKLPPEVIAELPEDASENLDHYLYGAPKK